MSRSKENVLELYVHFIVLGVVGVISLALLFKFVITSPSAQEFMGQSVSASDVDSLVLSQTKRVETRLASEPETRSRYVSKLPEFESAMGNSIANVSNTYFAYPGEDSAAVESQREYALPELPNPASMAAYSVRTVGFVPVVELGIQDSYEAIDAKPGDIDVVTVQATINVTALYESFDRTFAGRSIKAQWRDAQLAKVVFAGVQLQRQQLVDGVWSDWEVVQRTKIDKYRQVFNEVNEASDPSKAEILMPQFLVPELSRNSLQPRMYDIAQLDMKWYPPSIFPDYQRELANTEKERQKADRETARAARTTTTTRDTSRTTTPVMGGDGMGMPGMGGGMDGMGMGGMGGMEGMGMPGMGAATDRAAARRDRTANQQQRTTEAKTPQKRDFEQEFTAMKIKEDADISKLRDNVVIWAHDDSVQPGQTYRYRLRYGVFNPVAGKSWYAEQYAAYNDQIVLWSNFTDVTDKFVIDMREYIFPTSVKGNAVVVKVSKLKLGNWKTRDFLVNPGEFIGYEVEEEIKPSTTTAYNRNVSAAGTETLEKVDYSTGMVFLDLVDVQDWELAGTVKERVYQAMLYSRQGEIASLATKDRFWPSSLAGALKVINASAGKVVEISMDRTGMRNTPGNFGGDGMMGMPGMGMDGMGMPGMGMPGMGMPGM